MNDKSDAPLLPTPSPTPHTFTKDFLRHEFILIEHGVLHPAQRGNMLQVYSGFTPTTSSRACRTRSWTPFEPEMSPVCVTVTWQPGLPCCILLLQVIFLFITSVVAVPGFFLSRSQIFLPIPDPGSKFFTHPRSRIQIFSFQDPGSWIRIEQPHLAVVVVQTPYEVDNHRSPDVHLKWVLLPI